jgi:hypothetical protein
MDKNRRFPKLARAQQSRRKHGFHEKILEQQSLEQFNQKLKNGCLA